jgi:ribosomal protein S12 methylthiotransferase
VAEVRQLVSEGVKEINLISQDTTYYGMDLWEQKAGPRQPVDSSRGTTLTHLIRALNAIDGDFWIRLLYTHPAHWSDELIPAIAECEKVCRYIDMPLQHIHPRMLQLMQRETSSEHIEGLIARIRAGIPGIALRTTFIVGFPGETEAHFETLLDFIRTTRFERLGIFAYSQEDGTIAGKMAQQLTPAKRQKRRERAMAAQHEVAVQVAESFVGRTLKVLVEGEATARQIEAARVQSWEHGLMRSAASASKTAKTKAPSGKFLVARGEADAPDIDGRIYIRGQVPVGRFAKVRIVGHTDYDLIAEPI